MRAVVLVGGSAPGSGRSRSTRPSRCCRSVGVTMFERVIARLGSSGVDEAIVSLGFRPDRFVEAFPDGRCAGVRLHYAIEPEPLDTAGAIRFAARRRRGRRDVPRGQRRRADRPRLRAGWSNGIGELGAEATLHLIAVDDPSQVRRRSNRHPTDGCSSSSRSRLPARSPST